MRPRPAGADPTVVHPVTPRMANRPAVRLALISLLGLYFELTLIRWVPTQVRLLAYFSNFVLIAALLGLGLGMLLSSRRDLLRYFPAALLGLALVVVFMERTQFVLPIVSEGQFIWNYLSELPAAGVLAYAGFVAFFLAVAGVFVLLGHEVGSALRAFRPLAAYSINILGSVLGVVAFAVISYLGVSPAVWFGVGAVAFLAYLLIRVPDVRRAAGAGISLLAVVAVVFVDQVAAPPGVSRDWSPYYEIEFGRLVVDDRSVGYDVSVNKDSHQQALDLSERYADLPLIGAKRELYGLPYAFNSPRRVLIVGAGTGNDVATALREAPGSVIDAVEIDPRIAELGREIHPERPYDHPNVRVHIDDARSFLQKVDSQYDLIVFGFLDSHRLFSQMSSVRMDNYVYTREAFESVRDHLAPNGVVAVTFTVHERWIAERIYTVLREVFGHEPLVYQGTELAWGTTFLVGDSDLRPPQGASLIDLETFHRDIAADRERITWRYTTIEGFVDGAALSGGTVLLTDDWPYLYMRERELPANYVIVLTLTAIASVAVILITVPRVNLRAPSNWNFLLLGAAFALLEVKGITEVALVFGSTWITNSIVITAILVMILGANLVVARFPRIELRWVYLALFATVLFNYFVSLRGLLASDFWVQLLAAGTQVAAPLFFSGIVFARWFRTAADPGSALGANLIGAVLGAMLEYASLAVGLRQLYLVALLFYALSFLFTLRGVSAVRQRAGEVT